MIADRLQGTWELIESTSQRPDGSTFYPMGEDIRGLISYTSDGYVQVNLMRPGRPRHGGPQITAADPADPALSEIVRGYMAYAGRFRVDEAAGVVHHEFELALDPNLIGTPQVREITFLSDNEIELAATAGNADGTTRRSRLLWRRTGQSGGK